MILRSLIAIVVGYAVMILQICCGKWMSGDWGRPQWLILLMVVMALRDRTGLAVVSGAGVGFLADALEPHGMGRFFLLYSIAAWWIHRRRELHPQRLTLGTFLGNVWFCAASIPFLALIGNGVFQSHSALFGKPVLEVLLTSLWTTFLAIPLIWLFQNEQLSRSSGNRFRPSRSVQNRWNMLTN